MPESILSRVQKEYPRIDKAASQFVPMLTGADIKKDITLAAEMAGLKLLRATAFDYSKIDAGTIILGVILDEALDEMLNFVTGWAHINLRIKGESLDFKLPAEVSEYLADLVDYEISFDRICQQNKIEGKLIPFVAAVAALKLVAAGKALKLFGPANWLVYGYGPHYWRWQPFPIIETSCAIMRAPVPKNAC